MGSPLYLRSGCIPSGAVLPEPANRIHLSTRLYRSPNFIIRRVRKDVIKFAPLQPCQGFHRIKAQHFDAVCKATEGRILTNELLCVVVDKDGRRRTAAQRFQPQGTRTGKISRTAAPRRPPLLSRMLKRLSRVRSSVGRVSMPFGDFRTRPLALPDMILIGSPART